MGNRQIKWLNKLSKTRGLIKEREIFKKTRRCINNESESSNSVFKLSTMLNTLLHGFLCLRLLS